MVRVIPDSGLFAESADETRHGVCSPTAPSQRGCETPFLIVTLTNSAEHHDSPGDSDASDVRPEKICDVSRRFNAGFMTRNNLAEHQ